MYQMCEDGGLGAITLASADTHPQGEDAQQASSPMSGAIPNGETPK
jgi:hypothetical protein